MTISILIGDCRAVLKTLPDDSVHCAVTSPPYFGLRDYGVSGQIGLEATPHAFVTELVDVFREVRRVLRDDGTLWLNLGDSYAGSWGAQSREHAGKHAPNVAALSANQVKAARIRASGTGSVARTPGLKPKDLIGIPWRVAFALQADGWWLRSDIIWSKPSPMPESVTDRPTNAHEHVFLLAKSERYFFDAAAVREEATYSGPNSPASIKSPHGQGFTRRAAGGDTGVGWGQLDRVHSKINDRGRDRIRKRGVPPRHAELESSDQSGLDEVGRGTGHNIRNVWTIATQPFSEAHFATFPPALIEPCIRAGCPVGGTVLDPFGGAGTTGLVADRLRRDAILIELNPDYAAMARRRIQGDAGMFSPMAEAAE